MRGTQRARVKLARTTLALTPVAALLLGTSVGQARTTQSHGSVVQNARVSQCSIVVSGAPWHARAAGGRISGTTYRLVARGMSCSSVRDRVIAFTHQPSTARIKGPAGFTCRSLSTSASGDNLLYSGVCMHPPHNQPFFEWGPKIPGH